MTDGIFKVSTKLVLSDSSEHFDFIVIVLHSLHGVYCKHIIIILYILLHAAAHALIPEDLLSLSLYLFSIYQVKLWFFASKPFQTASGHFSLFD